MTSAAQETFVSVVPAPGDPWAYCLVGPLETAAGEGVLPWAPGWREEMVDVQHNIRSAQELWCMSEVEIFCDLSGPEMEAIAGHAPMVEFEPGELLFSPPQPMEKLFILKAGRVRIFRLSQDGRALTTAIVTPGTVFGEMLLLGQQMHDNFAEALDKVVVCVMGRSDVQQFLLSDARIAARISASLGNRVSALEQRLSDTVFKSAPQRVATTLCLLADHEPQGRPSRGVQIRLTHEQVAGLTGISRETATKILNEFAAFGLVKLGRGRITILDSSGLSLEAGDS